MATSWMKDPDATLDYTVDWSAWLAGDTISTVTWTISPSGTGCVSKVSQSNSTTIATGWFTGGTAGKEYSVACRIVTGGGRTDERTFTLKVTNR